VWDAGIESVGTLARTLIADNRIRHCLIAAVGAFWDTSWTGNTIRHNFAEDVPALFMIFNNRISSVKPQGTVYFKDNRFEGNVLRSPRASVPGAIKVGGTIDFENLFVRPQEGTTPPVLENNVLIGNDFGSDVWSPLLLPADAIVDGGGNICVNTVGRPSAVACEGRNRQSPPRYSRVGETP
jgi:hypothetical protein